MSNLSAIISGIDTAFDSMGDLVTAAALRVRVPNDFDTNVLRVLPKYTDKGIDKAVVLDYTSKELHDSGILPTDQKILIKGKDVSVAPVANYDLFVIGAIVWEIVYVKAAPKNVLYTLQVRLQVPVNV